MVNSAGQKPLALALDSALGQGRCWGILQRCSVQWEPPGGRDVKVSRHGSGNPRQDHDGVGLLMWDGKWSTSGRKLSLVCRGRGPQGCVRFQFPRWAHPAPTGQGHKWSGTDTRPITGGKIRTKSKVQVELPGSAMGPVSWDSGIKEDSFITAVWSEWRLLRTGNLAQPLRVGLDKFKYLTR